MAQKARSAQKLAELARALADANATEIVCDALRARKLTASTAAVARHQLAQGQSEVARLIHDAQLLWGEELASLDPLGLAIALRAATAAAQLERRLSGDVQLAWTGPLVEGSFLRSTLPVMREIVRGANQRLLIVGYWLAAHDPQGSVRRLVELIADAAQAGVEVVCVLDTGTRPYGGDNLTVLTKCWPKSVPMPTVLAWSSACSTEHRKLHAKVMVADRRDALVTSANMTQHAFDLNIEMGVRVRGRQARRIAKHFDLLSANGTLVSVDTKGLHNA